MEPSDNAGDKIAPRSSFFNGATILALLVIVAQILISAGTYPFLPPIVPSHFDAAGQVNGYMPKLVIAILYPGISIVLFLILRFITQIGPNLGYRNQRRANTQVVSMIMVGILLFNLVIQLLTTAYALGAQVNISLVISLAVSVLFIFLGNYLGKLRRNFWAGIRTPWTLASDIVWERTHRLGGWLFVLVGFIGLITSFFPPLRLVVGLLVPLIVVVIILTLYSYIAYQRYTVDGREPLSPPFDGSDGAPQ
jgi:uncharacterized membrane protein